MFVTGDIAEIGIHRRPFLSDALQNLWQLVLTHGGVHFVKGRSVLDFTRRPINKRPGMLVNFEFFQAQAKRWFWRLQRAAARPGDGRDCEGHTRCKNN